MEFFVQNFRVFLTREKHDRIIMHINTQGVKLYSYNKNLYFSMATVIATEIYIIILTLGVISDFIVNLVLFYPVATSTFVFRYS